MMRAVPLNRRLRTTGTYRKYNHHRYKYIHTDNKKAKFTYYNQSTHNFNMAVLVR